MDKETQSRALTYDCIFHMRKSPRSLGAVGCNDKSKCAVCGWNPRVQEQRLEKMKAKNKKMTLYEIDRNIEELTNAVDHDTGELTVDFAALDALMMERETKIENITLCLKNAVADAAKIREEEKALAARRQAEERKAERLKEYLKNALNGEKFSTAKCAVSFRKTSSVCADDEFVTWAKANNPELLRYKEPEVDKTAIKNLLAKGVELPHAKLIENTAVVVK